MAKKKAKSVEITDTKKTPKDKLIDEANAMGIAFDDTATVKQLKALIQTEKLKADLPAPAPPPPAMSCVKLPNKDIVIKIKAIGSRGPDGYKGAARVLQGLTDVDGEDKWKTLAVISPAGAPRIRLKARVDPVSLKLTQNVKKARLLMGSEHGSVLETMKL